MTLQVINVGTAPDTGTGDPLRTAYIKCNVNFGQLFSRYQTTPPGSSVGTAGDSEGMYAADNDYFYYCFQDYDGSSVIWRRIAYTAGW